MYSNVDPAPAGKGDNYLIVQRTLLAVRLPSIDVVRKDELQAGLATPGVVRKRAFETEDLVLSQTHLEAGVASGWHHHGRRHLYGFMIAGRLRLEYGMDGKDAVEVVPGDFFHIPPRLVHRDVNPDDDKLVVVGIIVGPGPPVINVNGPE